MQFGKLHNGLIFLRNIFEGRVMIVYSATVRLTHACRESLRGFQERLE
jgi:hypothetical protein